jgi:hypothetical protein
MNLGAGAKEVAQGQFLGLNSSQFSKKKSYFSWFESNSKRIQIWIDPARFQNLEH